MAAGAALIASPLIRAHHHHHYHHHHSSCAFSSRCGVKLCRITWKDIRTTAAPAAIVRCNCSYHGHHHSGNVRPEEDPDPYRTLGVCSTASREDIKKAYRRLALRFHPDVSPSPSPSFAHINHAYRAIMDRFLFEYGSGSTRFAVDRGCADAPVQPEPMMGVNDDSWEDWEEWMGWEGAGTRDYSSHINHSL